MKKCHQTPGITSGQTSQGPGAWAWEVLSPILPQVLVRVPCWHRQRMLPCIPKFKAVSCCGGDSLVPRNPDFRFAGEKAGGSQCQVSREYVALAVLPCVGGTWGESLEKIKSNQMDLLQSTLPTYLTLEKSPPSFQSQLKSHDFYIFLP